MCLEKLLVECLPEVLILKKENQLAFLSNTLEIPVTEFVAILCFLTY